MEILVHIGAPSSKKDDERHQAQGRAYLNHSCDKIIQLHPVTDLDEGSELPRRGGKAAGEHGLPANREDPCVKAAVDRQVHVDSAGGALRMDVWISIKPSTPKPAASHSRDEPGNLSVMRTSAHRPLDHRVLNVSSLSKSPLQALEAIQAKWRSTQDVPRSSRTPESTTTIQVPTPSFGSIAAHPNSTNFAANALESQILSSYAHPDPSLHLPALSSKPWWPTFPDQQHYSDSSGSGPAEPLARHVSPTLSPENPQMPQSFWPNDLSDDANHGNFTRNMCSPASYSDVLLRDQGKRRSTEVCDELQELHPSVPHIALVQSNIRQSTQKRRRSSADRIRLDERTVALAKNDAKASPGTARRAPATRVAQMTFSCLAQTIKPHPHQHQRALICHL